MNQTEVTQLSDFLESLHHLSEHTRSAYQRDLQNLQDYCDKQEINKWSDLDGRQVRGYVAWRHRKGIGGRSLQRTLSAIRAFYRYLLKQGIVKNNPAEGIIAPKTPRKLPKVLDVDQSVQLVEISGEDALAVRDRAILELIYSSGLRLSELVGLNMNDIDFSDRVVTVLGKGKKTRTVPVGQHAIKAVKNWLKNRQSMTMESEQALFVSTRGKRINPRSVQLRLKEWAIKQGHSDQGSQDQNKH